jgi:hypothetical protein
VRVGGRGKRVGWGGREVVGGLFIILLFIKAFFFAFLVQWGGADVGRGALALGNVPRWAR